jgi:hypothetical protein
MRIEHVRLVLAIGLPIGGRSSPSMHSAKVAQIVASVGP